MVRLESIVSEAMVMKTFHYAKFHAQILPDTRSLDVTERIGLLAYIEGLLWCTFYGLAGPTLL